MIDALAKVAAAPTDGSFDQLGINVLLQQFGQRFAGKLILRSRRLLLWWVERFVPRSRSFQHGNDRRRRSSAEMAKAIRLSAAFSRTHASKRRRPTSS